MTKRYTTDIDGVDVFKTITFVGLPSAAIVGGTGDFALQNTATNTSYVGVLTIDTQDSVVGIRCKIAGNVLPPGTYVEEIRFQPPGYEKRTLSGPTGFIDDIDVWVVRESLF